MTIRPAQQLRQGCKGPCGHDIGLGGLHSFDAADDDSGLPDQFHLPGRFAEERGLACIRFDQGYVEVGSQGGDDQARKPRASSKIGERSGALRDKGCELGRVGDVARPDVGNGIPADQVDGFLPTLKRRHKGGKTLICFT